MAKPVIQRSDEPWRRRLLIPNYQIAEAARYARIHPTTVAAWHKVDAEVLTEREERAELSYMQLIEVAVVAAFRKAGVTLKRIRAARDYASTTLDSQYPFAEFRFKQEGKHLWLGADQVAGVKPGTVVGADQGGQLAWESVIGRLQEFEYEHEGIVLRWYVAGKSVPIIIDPRISFGAPAVKGTPTWIIKGRYGAGESDSDIADDFGLSASEVRAALKFEGVSGGSSPSRRAH